MVKDFERESAGGSIDPLQRIVAFLRARPTPASGFEIEPMRAGMNAMNAGAPVLEGTRCEPVRIAGVSCEWTYGPGANDSGVILYLHGGGYVLGSLESHRSLVARISAASGIRALAVDYRLGPEHVFPAAVQDATAVYRELIASGIHASRIVIAGDSAGGGLSVATLLELRGAGDPLPKAAVLLSPWVDLEGTGASWVTKIAEDPIVLPDMLRWMASQYLGQTSPRTPTASPLLADLSGLPSLLIQVGTAEILLDDGLALARNAEAAGVDVEVERWIDMIHVWQALANVLPEARSAIDRIGAFVRARLA